MDIHELDHVDGLSPQQVDRLWGDNVSLCRLANKRRTMIANPPIMSLFRVVSLVLVTSPSGRRIFEGTNGEPGNYIGGTICAERAAALRARFIEGAQIAKVVVVSDCADPISPCALCREFLISAGTRTTQIVMCSADGEVITQCPLGDLFPLPSIFRFQGRGSIETGGLMFSERMGKIKKAVDADVYELYKLAFSCVKYEGLINIHGNVHPLNLAAACLYSNGETDVAVQMKGLSFGVSLDPISQLVGNMVSRLTLGRRVPFEDDVTLRSVESRIRNRSRDRTMGLVTRGYHQYNQKRNICAHCGAGRGIVLDVDVDVDVTECQMDGKSDAPAVDQRMVSPADFSTRSSSAGSSAPSSAAFEKGLRGPGAGNPDDASHPRLNHHRLNSEADFKDTSRPGTNALAIREMFDGDDDEQNLGHSRGEGEDDGGGDGYGGWEDREDPVTVRWVVMVDQFGICHAPPGRARALLTEHGFGGTMTVVHNERGAVEKVTADELLPSPPGMGRILKITDFV